MDRAEHLAWCKLRALAYLDTNDTQQAFASMASDLNKHPETQDHSGMELGIMLQMGRHLSSVPKMRDFIEGFN